MLNCKACYIIIFTECLLHIESQEVDDDSQSKVVHRSFHIGKMDLGMDHCPFLLLATYYNFFPNLTIGSYNCATYVILCVLCHNAKDSTF